MTAHPCKDCVDFAVSCVCRMNAFSVIWTILHTDIFVLGGGTLLQDRTSLRSFLYYVWIIRLAAFLGCRVELWGNGFGDIKSCFSLRLFRSALKCVDHIGVRDKLSEKLALLSTDGGNGTSIVLEGDLALSQRVSPAARIDWLLQQAGMKREDTIASFAVIAVKGGADRTSIFELETYMRKLREKGITFLYIPMFKAEDEAEDKAE